MNAGQKRVWQELVNHGAADFQAGKIGLSWCENCSDFTEDNVKDLSRGCVGHPDGWEAPDIVGYCVECELEK
tara:strand:- start:4019 stop:4234 length:216 start_codon:yes stop_codon:yes gene_type:complete